MRVLLLALCVFPLMLKAQLNLQQIGHLSYAPLSLAGCWHYVSDDAKEWALVGTSAGLSIVDLSIPSQPQERFTVHSITNNWREVKIWNGFAYFGSEAAGSGINIVDLRHLPDTIYSKVWYGTGFAADSINRSHALQAENGYLYVFGGGNITNGATIASLSDPWNPVVVGKYTDQYVHDGFIRGDTLWTSEIYKGWFGVVDISDKTHPVLLATQPTPGAFNHNSGLSDDSKVLFTTDEKSNAPLASFDVTDLDNIKLLDIYYPSQIPSKEVHNVRVFGDYLINPSYGGQLTIVDAQRPDNLIETAWAVMGTSLVWDADPYLPSGIVFATAKNEGLFIYQPTYQHAAWMEGNVYNAANGLPLPAAKVEIIGTVNGDSTDLQGIYKTGVATSGQYIVQASKNGYYTQTLSGISLTSGQVSIQDFYLVPDPTQSECDPAWIDVPLNGIDEDCDGLDRLYLNLPPYLYAVEGQPIEVLYRHHFLSEQPEKYDIVAETPLSGTNFTYKWQWMGLDTTGEYPFKILIRDLQGHLLDQDSCIIRVSRAQIDPKLDTFNVVLMGHSFFDQGWLPSFLQDITDTISTKKIYYRGNRSSWLPPFTHHEGYGGTTAEWFLNDPQSPLTYENNACEPQKLYDNIICPGCSPDWLLLHLDINEICNSGKINGDNIYAIDDSIQVLWDKFLFPLVDKLKSTSPDMKIGLCLSPPANPYQDAFDVTFPNNPVLKNRWRWQKIVNRLTEKYREKYEASDSLGIYIIPEQVGFDDASAYNNSDAIHPNAVGYAYVTQDIYAWMRWVMQPKAVDPDPVDTMTSVIPIRGDLKTPAYHLYPNPSTSQTVFVSTPADAEIQKMEVYALSGRLLSEEKHPAMLKPGTFSLRLKSDFSGGYLVRITTKNGVEVLRGIRN